MPCVVLVVVGFVVEVGGCEAIVNGWCVVMTPIEILPHCIVYLPDSGSSVDVFDQHLRLTTISETRSQEQEVTVR